jgi:hypothetical protein
MARIRLYLYNSHDGGATYVYDTGVFDSSAPPGAGCLNPDAQQFASIQDLLAYANSHAETVQQVNSVQEVNAICSGQVAQPTTQQGCMGGICGPQLPGGGTGTGQVPTTTTGGAGPGNTPPTTTSIVPTGGAYPVIPGTASPYGGGSPSPFGGQLPGFGGAQPTPTGAAPGAQGVGASGAPRPTSTAPAAGFDFSQFLRGPMGVLSLILVVGFLLLSRKGG